MIWPLLACFVAFSVAATAQPVPVITQFSMQPAVLNLTDPQTTVTVVIASSVPIIYFSMSVLPTTSYVDLFPEWSLSGSQFLNTTQPDQPCCSWSWSGPLIAPEGDNNSFFNLLPSGTYNIGPIYALSAVGRMGTWPTEQLEIINPAFISASQPPKLIALEGPDSITNGGLYTATLSILSETRPLIVTFSISSEELGIPPTSQAVVYEAAAVRNITTPKSPCCEWQVQASANISPFMQRGKYTFTVNRVTSVGGGDVSELNWSLTFWVLNDNYKPSPPPEVQNVICPSSVPVGQVAICYVEVLSYAPPELLRFSLSVPPNGSLTSGTGFVLSQNITQIGDTCCTWSVPIQFSVLAEVNYSLHDISAITGTGQQSNNVPGPFIITGTTTTTTPKLRQPRRKIL